MKTLRTLFSGGELFGIGAQQAGWRHVDGIEHDPVIAAIAQQNGFRVLVADVRSVDYTTLPAVDHLHASPPCTTASMANPNAGETILDQELAQAVCRAIAAHQGATFSLENVWGYRHFASCALILSALHAYGFASDVRHVNAADFGVPQTRKRLIVRAVRHGRVPVLSPTHRKGGDCFHAPWVGWYAAIADLIPDLPDTQPAPWQIQRLEKLPAFSFLIGNENTGKHRVYRQTNEASFVCTREATFRAYLVGSETTQMAHPTSYPRRQDEPGFTIRSGSAGSPDHCYLIDGANARSDTGTPIMRAADHPSMTIPDMSQAIHRIVWPGTWKALTVPALGRLQTLPDIYVGATRRIIGNGVPCLLAQRIMESLEGVR